MAGLSEKVGFKTTFKTVYGRGESNFLRDVVPNVWGRVAEGALAEVSGAEWFNEEMLVG
jgi:hypothetical protein